MHSIPVSNETGRLPCNHFTNRTRKQASSNETPLCRKRDILSLKKGEMLGIVGESGWQSVACSVLLIIATVSHHR